MSEAADACAECSDSVADPLARTVRLSVDRAQIDAQRLCPECFAEWIDRYQTEMQRERRPIAETDGNDIIVD